MQERVLPPRSRELLDILSDRHDPDLTGWVLAGGTGLGLHLGHRISDDFDFFRDTHFEPASLAATLGAAASCEVLRENEDDLTALCAGVKLSFFHVSEPFLYPRVGFRFFEVADQRDIALMKLVAISSRGSRRDFVDLYCILRGGPRLEEFFRELPVKYGPGRVNTYHVLKSLTYFDDAEKEPMPTMLLPFDWEDCKAFMIREAAALVL